MLYLDGAIQNLFILIFILFLIIWLLPLSLNLVAKFFNKIIMVNKKNGSDK